jgi:hypothetical protein
MEERRIGMTSKKLTAGLKTSLLISVTGASMIAIPYSYALFSEPTPIVFTACFLISSMIRWASPLPDSDYMDEIQMQNVSKLLLLFTICSLAASIIIAFISPMQPTYDQFGHDFVSTLGSLILGIVLSSLYFMFRALARISYKKFTNNKK